MKLGWSGLVTGSMVSAKVLAYIGGLGALPPAGSGSTYTTGDGQTIVPSVT